MPRDHLSHKWLSWSLSDGEYNRYLCEGFDVGFIEKPKDHLPLYPEYGQGPIPLGLYDKPYKRRSSSVDSKMSDNEDAIGHLDQSLLNEGDWDDPSLPIPDIAAAQMMENQGFVKDHEVVKTWLERRYRANDAALGSPMFQFMKEFYAKAKPQRYGSQSMCQYLSFKELYRWSIEGNYHFVFYNRAKPLYPDAGMWPEDGGTGLREERERLPVVRNRRSRKSESSSQQHKWPKKPTQTGKVKEEAKEQRKDQPAYVGRLRAGVSKRSHEKSGMSIIAGNRARKKIILITARTRVPRVQREEGGAGEVTLGRFIIRCYQLHSSSRIKSVMLDFPFM